MFFEALDPMELLKQIEERLVTTDQIEYKRLRFQLAKQTPEENLWKYKNRLQAYYREAQIHDEAKFVDVYKRGIYNNELRRLLMLHNLPLTLINRLKTAVHHYQTKLLT